MRKIFVALVVSLLLVGIMSSMALARVQPSTIEKEIRPQYLWNGLTPRQKKDIMLNNPITLPNPSPTIKPWETVTIHVPM